MSNYSNALEFCVENGIILDDAQSLDLYCTMEGANLDTQKAVWGYNKQLRQASKECGKLIKAGDYKGAKKCCNTMNKILRNFQKDVDSIDYTTSSNIISQVIYAALTLGVALCIPLSSSLGIKVKQAKFNKADKELKSWSTYKSNGNGAPISGISKAKQKDMSYNDKFNKLVERRADRWGELDNAKEFKGSKGYKFTALFGAISAALAAIAELKVAREDIKKHGGSIKNLNMLRADVNLSIKSQFKVVAALEKEIDKLAAQNR